MAKNMKIKAEKIAATADKRPYATAKYVRISPYKVRTVLALIRGKSVEEAEAAKAAAKAAKNPNAKPQVPEHEEPAKEEKPEEKKEDDAETK